MPNARLVRMTPREYRQHPAINQSSIKLYREDPLKYHGERIGLFERRTISEFTFGNDFEALVFTGKVPLVIIPPEALNDQGHRRNRKGESQWTDWVAEIKQTHPGAELVTEDDFQKRMGGALQAMDNLRKHPKANALLLDRSRVRYHQIIFWDDEETGVECKCEIDAIHAAGSIVDLKSARDINPADWAKHAFGYGYHVQAQWYRRAVHELTGEWMPFVFVVCKNNPGYGCEVFQLDAEFLALGEETIHTWLPKLVEADRTDNWKSETHGLVVQLPPPRWALYVEP